MLLSFQVCPDTYIDKRAIAEKRRIEEENKRRKLCPILVRYYVFFANLLSIFLLKIPL
jgi:hypothetical protein